ncbi:hypothetical protein [Streptomyces sp. NPDC051219]|uniref:baeRF2 domain-containing protein n=1 Tax=Streptomyces sp. NPDC051219 TaxID=3155283 RepID=UPI003422B57F
MLPLVLQHAPEIPYMAVALSRVAPEPRLSHVGAAGDWPQNAFAVAHEVENPREWSDAETMVLRSGADDVWLRGARLNRLPTSTQQRVITVPDQGRPEAEDGRALLEAELSETLQGGMSERDKTLRDRHLAQRARHPDTTEGTAAAVIGRGAKARR